ncbi:MAG: hypothetical protein AB8D78_08510 [Akkermansiaceae bacterium]
MKIKTLIATSTAAISAISLSEGSLILTGLVDGPASGGLPKAIELYVTADIADLSQYGVELTSNAGSTANAPETSFSGNAVAGDFIYVATEAPEFTAAFGFAPTFITNDVNHNGDDDFYIYGPGNTLIDVWGGSDGVDNTGTVSDILDSWAYRNDANGPNTTFTASEWTIAATNSLDGLSPSQTGAAVPFGTYSAGSAAVIPEPSTALLGALSCLLLFRRRR